MLKKLCNLKLLIGAAMCFAFSVQAKAQTNPITDAYAKVGASTGTDLKATFFIEVADTTDILQLEVKLGCAVGQTDLVLHTYDYDVTGGLPAGFTYFRTGNKVTLGTNDFSDMSTYFGTVRLKDGSGSWSDEVNFITN